MKDPAPNELFFSFSGSSGAFCIFVFSLSLFFSIYFFLIIKKPPDLWEGQLLAADS